MIQLSHRGLRELPGEMDDAAERLAKGAEDLEVDLATQIARLARHNAERGKLTGASQGSIRSQGPVVTAGSGVPWYGFADFGGSVGAGRRIKRPYIKGGRWLFPAVKEANVLQQAEKTLDKALGNLQK